MPRHHTKIGLAGGADLEFDIQIHPLVSMRNPTAIVARADALRSTVVIRVVMTQIADADGSIEATAAQRYQQQGIGGGSQGFPGVNRRAGTTHMNIVIETSRFRRVP